MGVTYEETAEGHHKFTHDAKLAEKNANEIMKALKKDLGLSQKSLA